MSLRFCPALRIGAYLCGAVLAAPALAGPDWIEGGRPGGPDAGSTIGVAQSVRGVGQLRTITGTLSSGGLGLAPDPDPDFEDMYIIYIEDPFNFFFEVTGASFDAQLWLFNISEGPTAFGLLGNNDQASTTAPRLTRSSNDFTEAEVTEPGFYALAISGAGRVPVSGPGLIFNFTQPAEISGPDGPGGFYPHTDWTGQGVVGGYQLEMQGVTWSEVPAPGAATLLLCGVGIAGLRRSRR